MADTLISFALYDSAGAPDGTAVPVFSVYTSPAAGALTAPSITALGGGVFSFAVPQAHKSFGVAYLVSTGAFPAHLAGSVGRVGAFAVYDSAGVPQAGATPSFAAYRAADGTSLTGPSISSLGGGLFAFQPVLADFSGGLTWQVATGGVPTYLAGALQDVDTLVTTVAPTPLATIAAAPPPPFQTPSGAWGVDVATYPDLDPTFSTADGDDVLRQALARRLTTPKGLLDFHPEYGLDLRAFLNGKVRPEQLELVRTSVESELEQDERVQTATAQVGFDLTSRTLSVDATVETANGPFRLTLAVPLLTSAQVSA